MGDDRAVRVPEAEEGRRLVHPTCNLCGSRDIKFKRVGEDWGEMHCSTCGCSQLMLVFNNVLCTPEQYEDEKRRRERRQREQLREAGADV